MSSERYLASCEGKQPLASRAAALKVIARRRQRVKNPGTNKSSESSAHAKLQPYHCRYCNHWHIGRPV